MYYETIKSVHSILAFAALGLLVLASINAIFGLTSKKLFTDKDLEFYTDLTKKIYTNEKVYFKIVTEDRKLIHDYLKFLTSFNINDRVYLMPEGKSKDELIQNSPCVFDMCEKYKFNFSS